MRLPAVLPAIFPSVVSFGGTGITVEDAPVAGLKPPPTSILSGPRTSPTPGVLTVSAILFTAQLVAPALAPDSKASLISAPFATATAVLAAITYIGLPEAAAAIFKDVPTGSSSNAFAVLSTAFTTGSIISSETAFAVLSTAFTTGSIISSETAFAALLTRSPPASTMSLTIGILPPPCGRIFLSPICLNASIGKSGIS